MYRPHRQTGYSLQSVLMTAFLACIGALLLFVLLTLVPRVSRLLQQNAIDRTKETVIQGVSSLDIYVDNMLTALHHTSTLLPTEPETADPLWQERLNFMENSRADIKAIAFFAQDGILIYGTGGGLQVEPQEVVQAEWFRKALAWQGTVTYFSAPHVQNLFGSQRAFVITLSRGVEYLQGGQWRTGVLLMDIDYGTLSSLVQGVTLGQSGYAYVLDEHDNLVCHPQLQQLYHGLADESLAAVTDHTLGVVHDRQGDRDRVLIITSVEKTRWRMVGVAYVEEILALQNAFIRIITVVLACAALLSLAAATVMAYAVTRPIAGLEETMLKVVGGDLNVAVAERGFREMRAVSSAFNHMISRIRALMDQILVEQEKKRLHELNALQAQINPHFLYNTLDSIIWMEERGRGREAIPMVSALARLFRISISKGRSTITVAEELEHVRNYLIIQKMRFKDLFDYTLEAQEEALRERTVKLIVQPLVENCINHAIDQVQGEALHICIQASVQGDDLLFRVADDGVGISAQRLPYLLTTSAGTSGIGLKNVHERIQLTYGETYGLTIDSVEDEGTQITIRIPRGREVAP